MPRVAKTVIGGQRVNKAEEKLNTPPPFAKPGTTSTRKAHAIPGTRSSTKALDYEDQLFIFTRLELKKLPYKVAQAYKNIYNMDELQYMLGLSKEGSDLYKKIQHRILFHKKKMLFPSTYTIYDLTIDDLCFILTSTEKGSPLYYKTCVRIFYLLSRGRANDEWKESDYHQLYHMDELEFIASNLQRRSPPLLKKTEHIISLLKLVQLQNWFIVNELKKEMAQYTLRDLCDLSDLFSPGSRSRYKTLRRIKFLKRTRRECELAFRRLKVPQSFTKPGETTSSPKVPDFEEEEILKLPKLDEGYYFSDLTEEQLMPSFGDVPKFRFVLCKVFLSYNNMGDDAEARRIYKDGWPRPNVFYLPTGTAHGTMVGSGHKLFGIIQAAGSFLDPVSPPFNIFNHKFNDPLAVPKLGFLSPHYLCYPSIPFSDSVKIAAKLNVTTDAMVDVRTLDDYCSSSGKPPGRYNDAFEICNDSAVINFSDYFAKRPNGGSCSYILNGRDGHLKLYYLALKYAVDAALEVVFDAPSEETKVAGRIMAYYGRNFDYGCSPTAELDDYKAMLFETEQPEVKSGKINLVQSVLSVPAQFSLIIDANLTDSTSGAIILSGVYEFLVPTDGGIRVCHIYGNDCSLELKVDWKLPPFVDEATLDKRSYCADLTETQVFSQRCLSSVTQDEEDGRYSVQKEFSHLYGFLMNTSFGVNRRMSVSVSTCTEGDEYDYLCTSVLDIWPEIRSDYFFGPKHAGLDIKNKIAYHARAAQMLERCVVGGPGFLKFKLSGTWIAESISRMVTDDIFACAPKLPTETAIIHILPRNIAKEMHMGHVQSAIIGETLARVLRFSLVSVRQRFHYGDYLDIESKMMMTEFLIDMFPNGEVNDQAIGELEVLYEESKKRFDEDAEFRGITQPVQDWDERHKSAWEQICKISQERHRKVYQRLGVSVKEEGKTLHDYYTHETRKFLRKECYNTKSEGDEAIVIEGRKLPLVDFAALWYSLKMGKADRIVHVADVGEREKIEMCITAAKSVGCSVTNQCRDPLSHVGFVQVKGFKGFGLVQLLDEAKSHCKAALVGKGKELEHAAEAFGCGAVKYEVLKNNRLTDYTFSIDDMLKETGNTVVYLQKTLAQIRSSLRKPEIISDLAELDARKDLLTLKDGRERQLGLHLLRFTEVLGEVSRVLAPHILCDFLFVLCEKFNGLYSGSCLVLRPDDKIKSLLFEATEMVIVVSFYLLGITPIYNFKFSTIK